MKIFDKNINVRVISGDNYGYDVKTITTENVIEGKRNDFVCQERETALMITLPAKSAEWATIQSLREAERYGEFNAIDAVDKIVWRLLDRKNWLLDICHSFGGCCDTPAPACLWCSRSCRHAGKKSEVIIASRHPATINYLQSWFAAKSIDTVVKPSVSKKDIAGKIVSGNLPINLAKHCKVYLAVVLPEDSPRGQELDIKYINDNAKLESYAVSFCGEGYEIL